MKIAKKARQGVGFALLLCVVFGIAFVGYVMILHHEPLVLPSLTGAYGVGRTAYDRVDERRVDPLADQVNEERELLIWVWYPADIVQIV